MGAGSELCQACGLCCDGTLFERLPLGADDLEGAQRLRLFVIDDAGGAALPLPCPAHDGACTVYDDRPARCRSYRCELLGRVEADEVPLEDALARVAGVREMIAAIRPHLPDPGGYFWTGVDGIAARPHAWKLERAAICLTIVTLRETLARFFDPRSRRTAARAP